MHDMQALMNETLDALGHFDAARLEALARKAEMIQARCAAVSSEPLAAEALRFALRSTESRLQMLDKLHARRIAEVAAEGGAQWER